MCNLVCGLPYVKYAFSEQAIIGEQFALSILQGNTLHKRRVSFKWLKALLKVKSFFLTLLMSRSFHVI
jgi:hypothetical protein